MESLKEKINSIIKGEVSNSSDDLKSRSTDASFFEIAPGLVVFPKDADDLKKLVRLVSKKEGVSLNQYLVSTLSHTVGFAEASQKRRKSH